MTNLLKTTLPGILSQAAGLAQGADEFGAILDLGPNEGAKIRLDITGLNSSISAYGLGKDELTSRRLVVEGMEKECRLFMMRTRDNMKPTLGYVHSSAWNTVGLIGSLKVPARKSRLLPLLSAVQAYLTSHPAFEDVDKGITAIKAGELYDELDEAIGAVNSQLTTVGNLLKTRNAKATKLRKRIRATIAALTQALDPIDARWEAFGLNQPGIKARPNQPQGLSAELIGPGVISVKWSRSARAEYYRVLCRIVGRDPEFNSAGTSSNLGFLTEEMPSNSVVEIKISAVNNGGESLLSEMVTVTIP